MTRSSLSTFRRGPENTGGVCGLAALLLPGADGDSSPGVAGVLPSAQGRGSSFWLWPSAFGLWPKVNRGMPTAGEPLPRCGVCREQIDVCLGDRNPDARPARVLPSHGRGPLAMTMGSGIARRAAGIIRHQPGELPGAAP